MKLTNTYIIGKHLPQLQGDLLTEHCALCGLEPDGQLQGLPVSEIISDEFMDTSYLGSTKNMCVYCITCMGRGHDRTQWIKNFNFIATPTKLQIFKKEELWNHIFSPPQEPFVFGVTKGHKKHISFKAPVNLPEQKSYQIQTENYTVEIKLDEKLAKLMLIIQNWYSVCKDTSVQPTWFIKEEILTGTQRYGVIEKYGIDDFLQEDKIIKPYRGTALLDLLTFLLNKGSLNLKGYALQKVKKSIKGQEKKIKESIEINK